MAAATLHHRTCIIVRLHTDDGLSGIGEGVVAPYFSGETLASAVHLVQALYAPLLLGADPFDIHAVGLRLDRAAYGNSATRSAVDIAPARPLGPRAGRAAVPPVRRQDAGQGPDDLPRLKLDPDKDAAEAAAAAAEGLRLIKVKVGSSHVDRDVACVEAVREAVGGDVDLLPDADQGWDVQTAIRFARRVEPARPLLIEQPLPRGDIAGMAGVRQSAPLVIAADEGVFTARDLYTHLAANALDGVVAKLVKAGSIAGLRQLTDLARVVGIGVHFAGMAGETSIAAAAAVHLATALPELRFHTRISPHDLSDDVVTTPLRPVNGALTAPEGPGLGVELCEEAVERLLVRDL